MPYRRVRGRTGVPRRLYISTTGRDAIESAVLSPNVCRAADGRNDVVWRPNAVSPALPAGPEAL